MGIRIFPSIGARQTTFTLVIKLYSFNLTCAFGITNDGSDFKFIGLLIKL